VIRVSSTVSWNLSASAAETRRRDGDQQRCGDHAERADDDQDQEQHAGDAIDQCLGLDFPATIAVFGQDGNEGLRERSLGKQPAQQVGQAEGDEEGVGHHAGAEGPGDDEVADESPGCVTAGSCR
jgi:hypothetical protein